MTITDVASLSLIAELDPTDVNTVVQEVLPMRRESLEPMLPPRAEFVPLTFRVT